MPYLVQSKGNLGLGFCYSCNINNNTTYTLLYILAFNYLKSSMLLVYAYLLSYLPTHFTTYKSIRTHQDLNIGVYKYMGT